MIVGNNYDLIDSCLFFFFFLFFSFFLFFCFFLSFPNACAGWFLRAAVLWTEHLLSQTNPTVGTVGVCSDYGPFCWESKTVGGFLFLPAVPLNAAAYPPPTARKPAFLFVAVAGHSASFFSVFFKHVGWYARWSHQTFLKPVWCQSIRWWKWFTETGQIITVTDQIHAIHTTSTSKHPAPFLA